LHEFRGARYESAGDREYRRQWHDYLRSGTVGNRLAERRDQAAGTQSILYSNGAAGGYFVRAGFVHFG